MNSLEKTRRRTESQRKWRKKNPIKNAYNNLKQNAKRRKKEFHLTFDQFKQFAIANDYIRKAGRSATSYHIDRIDETKGYTNDNIQVLTNSENIKKYKKFAYHWCEHQLKMVYRFQKTESISINDSPF